MKNYKPAVKHIFRIELTRIFEPMNNTKRLQQAIDRITANEGRSWLEIVTGTDAASLRAKGEFMRLCAEMGLSYTLVASLLKLNEK